MEGTGEEERRGRGGGGWWRGGGRGRGWEGAVRRCGRREREEPGGGHLWHVLVRGTLTALRARTARSPAPCARSTEQFATFLSRTPDLAGLVTVPQVYRDASAKRILTLERLYGVPLADLDSVRQYAPNPELALIVALNTWVSSVLTNEWFHADVVALRQARTAHVATHPLLASRPPLDRHGSNAAAAAVAAAPPR